MLTFDFSSTSLPPALASLPDAAAPTPVNSLASPAELVRGSVKPSVAQIGEEDEGANPASMLANVSALPFALLLAVRLLSLRNRWGGRRWDEIQSELPIAPSQSFVFRENLSSLLESMSKLEGRNKRDADLSLSLFLLPPSDIARFALIYRTPTSLDSTLSRVTLPLSSLPFLLR